MGGSAPSSPHRAPALAASLSLLLSMVPGYSSPSGKPNGRHMSVVGFMPPTTLCDVGGVPSGRRTPSNASMCLVNFPDWVLIRSCTMSTAERACDNTKLDTEDLS